MGGRISGQASGCAFEPSELGEFRAGGAWARGSGGERKRRKEGAPRNAAKSVRVLLRLRIVLWSAYRVRRTRAHRLGLAWKGGHVAITTRMRGALLTAKAKEERRETRQRRVEAARAHTAHHFRFSASNVARNKVAKPRRHRARVQLVCEKAAWTGSMHTHHHLCTVYLRLATTWRLGAGRRCGYHWRRSGGTGT